MQLAQEECYARSKEFLEKKLVAQCGFSHENARLCVWKEGCVSVAEARDTLAKKAKSGG